MRVIKTIAWILLWVALAALTVLGFSMLVFHNHADELFRIGPVTIHFGGIGAGVSFLTMVLTGALWLNDRKKRMNGKPEAIDFVQSAGFGFLPAAAVWSLFFSYDRLSLGSTVFEPLTGLPLVTENGLFLPARIEFGAALAAFLGIVIWLMIRKNDPARDGSLLMISAGFWAMIRIITETFRGETGLSPDGIHILRYAACAVILIDLTVWTVRRSRAQKSAGQSVLDWLAVIACMAVIVLTSEKILSVGSEIGNFAVIAGAAVLSWVVTLTAAADSGRT